MAIRQSDKTTITIDREDRDNLNETLDLVLQKFGKRRYFMPDLIHDMHTHYRKYLEKLPDYQAN